MGVISTIIHLVKREISNIGGSYIEREDNREIIERKRTLKCLKMQIGYRECGGGCGRQWIDCLGMVSVLSISCALDLK